MGKPSDRHVDNEILQRIAAGRSLASKNLHWLRSQMHPYFFITMQEEQDAIARLAADLKTLARNRRLLLADRENALIVARPSVPGSLYETLRTLTEKEISYAQMTQSYSPIPGLERELEIQRFEFDRKGHQEIAAAAIAETAIPEKIREDVQAALKEHYPRFDFREFYRLLQLLWLNNERYVRISPSRRVAQVLWIYQQAKNRDGVYFNVEETEGPHGAKENRIMFAAGNPPQKDFLLQTMEVFRRLGIGIKRAYCLTIDTDVHPYFLGTFYVRANDAGLMEDGPRIFDRLQKELYNTQILSTSSPSYSEFVTNLVMTGENASLANAFIAFCHTNLSHNQIAIYTYEDVMRAFHSHPELTLELIKLFRIRFDPAIENRSDSYRQKLEETTRHIDEYNTGHRFLDDFRRSIFRCCLAFIRHTLKTNFFVLQKQALAFRLDPAYLDELGEEFTSDLPEEIPFRVTFFFGRYGTGYHIGFSDIARGGWRTVITRSRDDYVTCANTLLREVYVLAHTQHLKNKDIYEGGSKMVVVLDAAGIKDDELTTQRLYKLQYGIINAFLDLFITDRMGRARDRQVVDYYGDDEPIELGPDENMHDGMVELIARQSVKRDYMLGVGLISSKQAGINHREFGVTSTGVVKFAEITLRNLGTDIHNDPFSVKLTGGPNGDVAGNAMRLLLERCRQVGIRLIVDGSGALYDPVGANRSELKRILLKQDLEAFDPEHLNPGGFILYRNRRKREGLRELFKKTVRGEAGLEEYWVTLDDFHREYDNLLFTVPADLFIPAGGRPETVDQGNWHNFFREDGTPTAKAIIEGANSFITPAARSALQKKGIILLRDASANKCGVISSSYEIIANLLLNEQEFLARKKHYIADVIEILEKRAEDEARLIFRRHRETGGSQLFSDISDAVSTEINSHYARLFNFFQKHSYFCHEPLFQNVILSHLPRILREDRTISQRLQKLPEKYLFAILASEIASSLVYRGDREADFLEMLKGHLNRNFPTVSGSAVEKRGLRETLSDAAALSS